MLDLQYEKRKNSLHLIEDGMVVSGDREFTRLVGGFNDDESALTTKQIAELMGYDNSIVNRTINRNINSFTENVDIIDLKVAMPECDSDILNKIGYTRNAYNASRNVYILSQYGYRIYMQLSDIANDFSEFEILYFRKLLTRSIIPIRYEYAFGKVLAELFSGICKFNTQFSVGKYRIDFYEPTYKLAIEYDELHHLFREVEDLERQERIEKELNCKFIRVKKGEEIKGLNDIIKYVTSIDINNFNKQ